MQFKKDANVMNATGDKVGEIDRVVIDPKNGEISHVVVKKGFLLAQDKVLPVEDIAFSEEDRVHLKEGVTDLDHYPDYLENSFVPADSTYRAEHQFPSDSVTPLYYYPTTGAPPVIGGFGAWGMSTPPLGPVLPTELTTHENIPDDTIALKQGAAVVDLQGETVGKIDQVITQGDREQVTHLVITKGLFDAKKKLIPASWIKGIKEDQVLLAVPAGVVESLKEYEE